MPRGATKINASHQSTVWLAGKQPDWLYCKRIFPCCLLHTLRAESALPDLVRDLHTCSQASSPTGYTARSFSWKQASWWCRAQASDRRRAHGTFAPPSFRARMTLVMWLRPLLSFIRDLWRGMRARLATALLMACTKGHSEEQLPWPYTARSGPGYFPTARCEGCDGVFPGGALPLATMSGPGVASAEWRAPHVWRGAASASAHARATRTLETRRSEFTWYLICVANGHRNTSTTRR